MKTVPMVVGVLLVSLLLGGCLQGIPGVATQPSLPYIHLNGSNPCDPAIVENCEEVNADPLVPYRLHPIELHMADTRDMIARGIPEIESVWDIPAALVITDIDRDVIVPSIKTVGYPGGILVEEVDCPFCTIYVQEMTILEDNEHINQTGNSLSQVIGINGMSVYDSVVSVSVKDALIYLREKQGNNIVEGGYHPESTGIISHNMTGDLYVENVRIGAPGQTLGAGIHVDLNGEATIQNVSIWNYRNCISFSGGNVHVENFHLTECTNGVRATTQWAGRPLESVHLRHFHIEDAREFGIYPTPPHPWLCPEGFQMINEFLSDSFETFAIVEDGTIERAGTAGIASSREGVHAERLTLVGNGHDPSGDFEVSGGAISLCHSRLEINHSIFEENTPWGAYVLPFDDVSNNWWGSSTGPNINPIPLDLPHGEGDRLFGTANYLPYLTERPW